MPNSSKANTRRKRTATQKMEKYRDKIAGGEGKDDRKLSQGVGYGMPGNVGSGNQVGSAERIDKDAEKDSPDQ